MARAISIRSLHLRKPARTVLVSCGLLAVFGFALPILVALHLSSDARPLGPRRVTDLIERFLNEGYDLRAVAAGQVRVPRMFLPRIPKDWRGLVPADKRKEAFVILVLPLVLQANEDVDGDRQRLLDLVAQAKKGKEIQPRDQEWLADLASTYDTKIEDLEELTRRVDGIPPSLALAQAAMESGWGTSRFTTEGNALFGQWTMDESNAMVPNDRDADASHGIRRFQALTESVASYFRNLNSHRAYAAFRKQRAALRAKGQPLDGPGLARHLASYSEQGPDYVEAIQSIIEANDLASFDTAKLETTTRPTLLGVLPKNR